MSQKTGLKDYIGYLPFLGRYLHDSGPVFTRISKREFKNGRWINRNRGCQCQGLVKETSWKSFAQMVIASAIVSATKARKIKTGPVAYHKPVWPEELGSLSLFLYVIEELIPTTALTARELESEGHNPYDFGLIAESDQMHRGVLCGDLDNVRTISEQLQIAHRKLQATQRAQSHYTKNIRLIRVRGRWLYDPQLPKSLYF